MPQVSTVNKALEYDMGADVFDLLFDRGCVFEGRGCATKWTADSSRTTARMAAAWRRSARSAWKTD
jgi:hypothetical protein